MEQALYLIAAVPFTPQVFVQKKMVAKGFTVLSELISYF